MKQNNKESLNIIKWHLKQIDKLTQSLVVLSGGLPRNDSTYDDTIEDVLHTLSTLIELEINCIKKEIDSVEEHI